MPVPVASFYAAAPRHHRHLRAQRGSRRAPRILIPNSRVVLAGDPSRSRIDLPRANWGIGARQPSWVGFRGSRVHLHPGVGLSRGSGRVAWPKFVVDGIHAHCDYRDLDNPQVARLADLVRRVLGPL